MLAWKQEFFDEILAEFQKESDRAAAIVAAAYLESALSDGLLSFVVDNSAAEGFVKNRTFGAKIEAAFALGFLDADTKADLDLILQIRNRFSHRHHVRSFDDSEVTKLCKTLRFAKVIEAAKVTVDSYQKPRTQYIYTVAIRLMLIKRWFEMVQRRTIPTIKVKDASA